LIAGGLGALRPNAKEAPDRKTFEDRLTLRGTVGPRDDNHASDRRWLKSALGVLGHLKLGEALSDDLDDERLGDAIESLNPRTCGMPALSLPRPGVRDSLARFNEKRTGRTSWPSG
jgi:hypothetical protein